MGAAKKLVKKVIGGGGSSAPAPAATVATTTPSGDGSPDPKNYMASKGKRSLLKGRGTRGGIGYKPSGTDFALFLEELMKRKTLG
jgi:hypothetical protein